MEVSVLLTDDAHIRELNAAHIGHAYPTDVISFPQQIRHPLDSLTPSPSPPILPLGDVVISLETAAHQAREYRWSVDEELALLAAHATLHLLGYDDRTRQGRAVMKRKQQAVVSSLALKPAGRVSVGR